MMTNRCLLFLAGTIFLCCAAAAAGAEPAPGSSVTVTIDEAKAAKEAAENKKAVINQLIKLFLDRRPPVLLSTQAAKEAKPEFSVVNGNDGMATMIYRCRYIDPEYLTDALDAVVTDAGTVELVKKLGSEVNEYSKIVIYDRADKMEEIKNVLLELDKLQPQVLVEAQIIEVYSEQGAERDVKLQYQYYDGKYDTLNTFGFNMDSPTQNRSATASQGGALNFVPFTTSSSDGSQGQLSAAIRWLNSSRNARILSAPNVIADQGAKATITTAEELPIPETAALTSSTNLSFKFKQVGVTLKITPELINGQTAQLSVNPQVRSVLRYQSFSQNNVTSNIPVISVRSVDTRLTVSDGDIIILGGLYNSEKSDTLRKLPFVGDLPVIGDLVNGRDSSSVDKQLLFLLKVHIIHPGKAMAFDPGSSADDIHKAAGILEQSRKIFTNKPASEFVDVEGELNAEAKRMQEKRADERSFLRELFNIRQEKQSNGETASEKNEAGAAER